MWQSQGVGTQLYEHVLVELQTRDAIAVRSNVRESMPKSAEFLEHRGFVEMQRAWESRLDVSAFDLGSFHGARPRAAQQGIVLTDLAAERERHPDCLRAIYDMHAICELDVPSIDPVTVDTFENWVKGAVEGPMCIPDAYFLAIDGDRYAGESALFRSTETPDVLYQGLTAVLPEYRGRGVAMALKIHGLHYARAQGIREIRTWNDTRNRAMLRINEAMGFVKQPVWITYQKQLDGTPG